MEIKILGSYIKNYGIANYMIYFVVFDNILFFLGGGLGVGVNVNSFKMVFKDEIMFLNSRLLKKNIFPFNMNTKSPLLVLN